MMMMTEVNLKCRVMQLAKKVYRKVNVPHQRSSCSRTPPQPGTVHSSSTSFARGDVAVDEAASIADFNSISTAVFIGVGTGSNADINGLYSPAEERGEDGRILYRTSPPALAATLLPPSAKVVVISAPGRVSAIPLHI